jgi:hypothetical protein
MSFVMSPLVAMAVVGVMVAVVGVAGDSVPTLTVQVEPKKTICMYETITPGQVTASWEVVRGGLLDINVAVRNKERRKVFFSLFTIHSLYSPPQDHWSQRRILLQRALL